jgi:hypothetical protein
MNHALGAAGMLALSLVTLRNELTVERNSVTEAWSQVEHSALNSMTTERRTYNRGLQQYGSDIERFPKNVAASLFGFGRNDAHFKAAGAR